jgi:hypothetical protein
MPCSTSRSSFTCNSGGDRSAITQPNLTRVHRRVSDNAQSADAAAAGAFAVLRETVFEPNNVTDAMRPEA